MLVRNPIVVPTNGYQQSTPANGIHMAGWRVGRREISKGRDYYIANITAESTPRYITCRQNTRLFLYASKCTQTLDSQLDSRAHTLSTTWITRLNPTRSNCCVSLGAREPGSLYIGPVIFSLIHLGPQETSTLRLHVIGPAARLAPSGGMPPPSSSSVLRRHGPYLDSPLTGTSLDTYVCVTF